MKSEEELNQRKPKALLPGTPLSPLPSDSKVPIILCQTKSLVSSSNSQLGCDSRMAYNSSLRAGANFFGMLFMRM
jgi:hypothetical protein